MNMENKALDGIVCSVSECEYHEPGDKCTASQIKVGGACDCKTSCNTECVTFKPCSCK